MTSMKFVRRFYVLLVLAWTGVAVGVNFLAPCWKVSPLADTAPISAPAHDASLAQIDRMFPGTGTDNIAYVVVESGAPIQDDTRAYIGSLTDRLRNDTHAVRAVVDMSSDSLTAPIAYSADRRSVYVQTWLQGGLGSPEGLTSVEAVRAIVHAAPPPRGLRSYLTGPAAAAARAAAHEYGELAVLAVIVATAGLVFAVTRSLLIAGVVLLTAYLALAIALPMQTILGPLSDAAPPSAFSLAITLALTVGASLAYTQLLNNRLRLQTAVNDDALTQAYRSITPIIVGSAAVLVGALVVAEAPDLPELRGIGISAGIAIIAVMLLVFTLAPGWAGRHPHRPPTQRSLLLARAMRLRMCAWLFRRPRATVAVVVVIVLGCAVQLSGMKVSFHEPGMLARGAEPELGYAAAARHFTANRLFPQTVVIESRDDLRNPAGLLAIDRVTRELMAVPQVRLVQSASAPAGLPWPDATLAHQFGDLNRQLQSDALSASPLTTGILGLPKTVDQLTASTDQLHQSLTRGVSGLSPLSASLNQLRSNMTRINDTANTVSRYADPVRQWVAGFADCTADVLCAQIVKVIDPIDNVVGDMSQLTASTKGLSDGLTTITQTANTAVRTLTDLRRTVAELQPLVDQLALTVKRVMPQLTQLTAFINVLTDDLSNSEAGGFYFPQQAIDGPGYQTVKRLMFSADGHATRLLVYSDGDVFGADGARTTAAIAPAVANATKYGPLAESAVHTTDVGFVDNAHAPQWHVDLRTTLAVSLILIFAICALMLRSLRAGLAIAAATLAAFVSGLGISVFLWSHVFGAQINWTAPLVSLIIVVAAAGDDAFRLTTPTLQKLRGKPKRGAGYYVGGSPIIAAVLICAVVVLVWVAALAGPTAVVTSSFGQISAITGFSLTLSYVGFRTLLIAAAAWQAPHRAV
jgi:putative drug exporter of the RND superfamily